MNKNQTALADKAQQSIHAFIKEYCHNGITKDCFECKLFYCNQENEIEFCKLKNTINDINDIIFFEAE